MIKRIARLLQTLRYLKPIQLYYRPYFLLAKKLTTRLRHQPFGEVPPGQPLQWMPFSIPQKAVDGKKFSFLNLEKEFTGAIDWNYADNGKLWTYKLNYFDVIHAPDADTNVSRALIDDYSGKFSSLNDGLEPYPISLRNINWVKFFIQHGTTSLSHQALYRQSQLLYRLPEYHLLGNHLIENGFGLLFSAYYFRDEKFYRKAYQILVAEISEQILSDGGHFELSPMYHGIILHRVLDAINLVKHNPWKDDDLLSKLEKAAQLMLSWYEAVAFGNGEVPAVNDAVRGEIISPSVLVGYARKLGISWTQQPLKASGYRMVRMPEFELFIDVGNVGPDYIPGHAHSDTFNFLLTIGGKQIFTERGTSTYLPGKKRMEERSTAAHNTVVVNGLEQTDVWATFRVGRRAKIISCAEGENTIEASHDGYKPWGVTHSRAWAWSIDRITITDNLLSGHETSAEARFHFHPEAGAIKLTQNRVEGNFFAVEFAGVQAIEEFDYELADGFNKVKKAKGVKVVFKRTLTTEIFIKPSV